MIPRVDSRIVAYGRLAGYDISEYSSVGKRYTKTVEIPEVGKSVDVPDFEIEQIPSRKIVVVDNEGQPLPDARVGTSEQDWLDDKIVIWESFSTQPTTGPDGTCLLEFFQTDWTNGSVFVRSDMNGVAYVGRTAIDPNATEQIVVRAQPPGQITGKLSKNGKPAPGVSLVLYEMLKGKTSEWTSIGVRDQATTDERGQYEFQAEIGVQYMIVLKERDADGVQRTLHRITEATKNSVYAVSEIDITRLNETK